MFWFTKSIPVSRKTCNRRLVVEVGANDVTISHVAWQQRLQLHSDAIGVDGVDKAKFVGHSQNNKVGFSVFQGQLISLSLSCIYRDIVSVKRNNLTPAVKKSLSQEPNTYNQDTNIFYFNKRPA